MTAPNVIGLDLSLTSTGIAGIKEGYLWGLDRVRTTGKKGDTLTQRRERIRSIVDDILLWVDQLKPHLAVIESPSYGSTHGSPHDRSGLWWLVTDALHELDLPVATVSPQGRAKYGTGKGNAKKADVYAAVKLAYPGENFSCDDQADALLLAAMGARHLGYAIDPWQTSTQLLAMDGAAWPVI